MPTKWSKERKVFFALIFPVVFICLVPFLPLRKMAWPFFFLTLFFFYFQFWRGPKYIWIGTLLLFITMSLLPIEISLRDEPGPPRFIPYVRGYPSEEAKENPRQDEFVKMDADFEWWDEPKWIWVW